MFLNLIKMEVDNSGSNISENIDNININIEVPSLNNESSLSSNQDSRDLSASGFYGSKLQKSIYEKKNEIPDKKDNFEKLKEKISKEKNLAPIKLFNFYCSQPNEHYFCKDCGLIPIVQFLNTIDIIYLCNCKNKTPCKESINKFLENKIIKINEKDEFNCKIFYCQEHRNQNYCYYCNVCKINLCRRCIREKNEHKGHNIIIFDELMNEADKKIKFIREKFNINSNSFESQSSDYLKEKIKIKFKNIMILCI